MSDKYSVGPFEDSLSEYSGIPLLFMDFVQRWLGITHGGLVDILVKEKSRVDWEAVGDALVKELMNKSPYVGVCFDGDCPFRAALPAWLSEIMENENQSFVSIDFSVTRQPPSSAGTITWHTNATWASIQPVADVRWISSLWQSAQSASFNYGTDLIIATLDKNLNSQPLESFRIDDLAEFITADTFWLIPIDGNHGFIIGVPKEHYRDDLVKMIETMPNDTDIQ
jgi:hypothetical protein